MDSIGQSSSGKGLDEYAAPDVAAAIEANTVAWLTSCTRLPGAELREERHATWYVTGRPSPLLNGVVRAQFPAGAAEPLGEQIAGLLAPFRARRLPMSWWTGPSTRPADLGAHLEAAGLRRAFVAPGMAADLWRLPDHEPGPAGLTVRRVLDPAGLEAWLDAGQRGPTPAAVRGASREANAALALDPAAAAASAGPAAGSGADGTGRWSAIPRPRISSVPP